MYYFSSCIKYISSFYGLVYIVILLVYYPLNLGSWCLLNLLINAHHDSLTNLVTTTFHVSLFVYYCIFVDNFVFLLLYYASMSLMVFLI
jgi:hypothetical protein